VTERERTALDVHIDAADRAGQWAPTVIDLDWQATAYRTVTQYAARVADELDVRALTRAYVVGRLQSAVTTDGATDEQIGRFARGLIQALTDLRLDVRP
jgi:cytosine/adenosine deaminase-related metal-dependent hydrolase